MNSQEDLDELSRRTKEWLDSEEGQQKIKQAIEEAEATKELWSQGRRLPSECRNRRINI